MYAYTKKKLIDFPLSVALLTVTVPVAVVRSLLAGWAPAGVLKVVLGLGLMAVALSFLRNPDHKEIGRLETAIKEDFPEPRAKTRLVAADGEVITYTVCNKAEGRIIAGIGGLFLGLISTGMGELNGYFLLRRCRVPSKVPVATSVFVVAVTALSASVGHFVRFARAGGDVLTRVLNIAVFTLGEALLFVPSNPAPMQVDRIRDSPFAQSLISVAYPGCR